MSLSKFSICSASLLAVTFLIPFDAKSEDNCAQVLGAKFTLNTVEKYHNIIHPVAVASFVAKTPDQARAVAIRLETHLNELEKVQNELNGSDAHLQCLVKAKELDASHVKGIMILNSFEEANNALPASLANLSKLAPEKSTVFQRLATIIK